MSCASTVWPGCPNGPRSQCPATPAIYAATFAGRRNAKFVPLAGYHRVVQRRAGDDSAAVIASNDRDLASGTQAVGYGSPDPGNYWEAAAAVITSAT